MPLGLNRLRAKGDRITTVVAVQWNLDCKHCGYGTVSLGYCHYCIQESGSQIDWH